MSEFNGKAGTIYIEEAKNVDNHHWEVWFEDLCILGVGNSQIEALNDAMRHVENISHLISTAIITTLGDVARQTGPRE